MGLELPGQNLSPYFGLYLGAGGLVAALVGWSMDQTLVKWGGYAMGAVGAYLFGVKIWKYSQIDSADLQAKLKSDGIDHTSYIGKLILALFGPSNSETGSIPKKQ